MTGTVVVSEERFGPIKKVSFAWTSTAGGAAGDVTTHAYSGKVERLVTVPGAGGAAPTDDYDVAVLDEDGVDILLGGGANRDTANTEQVAASSLGIVANDKLTLAVTNAGNAKSGVVHVYLKS